MAKKRKHGSRAARDQRLNANTRLWMWEAEPPDSGGHDFVLHIQRKDLMLGWHDVTDQRLIDNLFDKPRNWAICGRALCRAPDGVEWMEQAYMTLPSCKLLEINDAYATLRKAVLQENRLSHIYDCGWIAQTWMHKDPSEVDPQWMYHDGPPPLAPARIAGLGFTEDRRQWWQMVNERETERATDTSNG